MTGFGKYAHTASIFRELQLLKVHDIITYQTLIFVHKCLYVYEDKYGFELATHTNVQTRHANQLKIPLYKTSHAQQCLLYQGSKLWNEVPSDLKSRPLNSFKMQTKRHLKSKY